MPDLAEPRHLPELPDEAGDRLDLSSRKSNGGRRFRQPPLSLGSLAVPEHANLPWAERVPNRSLATSSQSLSGRPTKAFLLRRVPSGILPQYCYWGRCPFAVPDQVRFRWTSPEIGSGIGSRRCLTLLPSIALPTLQRCPFFRTSAAFHVAMAASNSSFPAGALGHGRNVSPGPESRQAECACG